jgi:hypothetical protein
VDTSPAPKPLASWKLAIAAALGVIALLLFLGSLRVMWPHPAYLLMMIAAGSIFAFGAGGRERKTPIWPLASWIILTVVAREIFYDHTAMLSWRSAQHHAALVLSAIVPILYVEWGARERQDGEEEGSGLAGATPNAKRRHLRRRSPTEG